LTLSNYRAVQYCLTPPPRASLPIWAESGIRPINELLSVLHHVHTICIVQLSYDPLLQSWWGFCCCRQGVQTRLKLGVLHPVLYWKHPCMFTIS